MVAVEIVASQASVPAGLFNQRAMRNINRVVVHGCVLMTILACQHGCSDPTGLMLLVAANARINAGKLPGLGEFRLLEPGHRVAIAGIVVARKTLIVSRGTVSKITRCR